ncbi:MAG: nucleotidyl transferase AbiEii/AbiGii toxin family protein [Egibacteraceae bacterium]
MLTPAQVSAWAQRLGVAEAQVRFDHLLSHLLSGVAAIGDNTVVFIGGTALCRTHLVDPPWTRVSEDLDLLVVGDHAAVTATFERLLPRAIRREFPDVSWVLAPTQARAPVPAQLRGGTATVRVQMLPGSGGWASWRRIPRERRGVCLRYEDTPGTVELTVPTLEGFAAMKLAAWEDRHAERDIFDLAALTTLDAFNTDYARDLQ